MNLLETNRFKSMIEVSCMDTFRDDKGYKKAGMEIELASRVDQWLAEWTSGKQSGPVSVALVWE